MARSTKYWIDENPPPNSDSTCKTTSAKSRRITNQRQPSTSPDRKQQCSLTTGTDVRAHGDIITISRSPSPGPMPVTRALPLLICSIGNPGPTYANTLHSAGHTVLNCLGQQLGNSSFSKDRSLGNGLVSNIGDWTLWQSTSYMNDSGKGVRAAWQAWSRRFADGESRLVVVHDELEKPLGAISLRTASGASAKGHNGLKSIMAVLGNTPFARIGVGIGRPVSRDSSDVASYVLKKMSPSERLAIENSVAALVGKLKLLEQG